MTSPSSRLRLCLVLAAALGLGACGGDDDGGGPDAAPDPFAAPAPPGSVTVSHVLIGIKAPGSKATRSKESALALAKEVIADAKAGRRAWQDLVDRFSDDRNDATGKANSRNFVNQRDTSPLPPGTYVIDDATPFVPEFKAAVKKLGVGDVTPEPVETQFGYHVIKRVR
jgi:hypothetical protein